MPVDLYKLYRGLAQRARRDDGRDPRAQELAELAHDLVKCNPSREEMLSITAKMISLEDNDPRCIPGFAWRMHAAVTADDYIIDVPYTKRHAWRESADAEGYLYLATARSRRGQVKIGATYDDPAARLAKYSVRHGYAIKVVWSTYISRPFSFESDLHRAFAEQRAPQRTPTDSIEWYRTTLAEMKVQIEKALAAR